MASTTFRFLKFGTSRQFFFQILCSKKNFENFFWSDQKTGLTARRVHYGPFRSPRSISGPYQKMTIPLLNSPKPHPLLIYSLWESVLIHCDLVIFGHWVLKIHQNFRKLRKRKFRGYCYVVIGANDCKNAEKFKKPKIVRLFVCNDWVYAHGNKIYT